VTSADSHPRVSVIMPVYNDERFLGRAIESILAQTLADLELIVVNDGSTDGTAAVLERYSDPRLRKVHQANGGIACALNTAIGVAAAPYIARMDSDDIALPERLERQAAYLDAHPECGLVGSSCDLVSDEGVPLGETLVPTDDAAIRRRMIRANPFIHSSAMLRREVFDTVGRYEMPWWEDYDLWWRILSQYRVANLPQKLVVRTHRLAATTRIPKTRHYREMLRIQCRIAHLPAAPRTVYLAAALSLAAFSAHWVRERVGLAGRRTPRRTAGEGGAAT
jgi:glycosyltransferase involved in cell wall biosynthesis